MKPMILIVRALLAGAAGLSGLSQPLITTPPFGQAVEAGATVSFRVVAFGEAPLAYHWLRNGLELPDATNTMFRLPTVQEQNAASYAVRVTDRTGSVTSPAATLAVHVPTVLIPLTNTWRFNESGEDLGVEWRATGYDDSAWPEGRGLFHNESRTLPVPKLTLLSLTNGVGAPITTYYFRTRFHFGSGAQPVFLVASNYVDDGAVFYLNGVEVGRLRMEGGPVTASTAATVAPEGRVHVMQFPAEALVPGDNLLAVEVHQHDRVAADVVFGMSLKATTLIPPLPDLVLPLPPGVHLETQHFAADACEVLEGCGTPGLRRLLRFDTEVRNLGPGDWFLGDPASNPEFVRDGCHNHYHYDNLIALRLLDERGVLVSASRKIGFAPADVDRWDTTNAPPNTRFNNDAFLGVQRGWSDIYSYHVPCQYVDITDVPPGRYTLELEMDPDNKVAELDEHNNVTRLTVELPADWAPCDAPPPNDDLAHAQLIPADASSVTGSTVCATEQSGEPVVQDAWGNRGFGSIWFRWTAPMHGSVMLDTLGSDFPTVLALYRGTAFGDITRVVADTDFRGPARTSSVMAAVVGGETYSISLAGYYDAREFVRRGTAGQAVLNLHLSTNDLFATAQLLEGEFGTVTATTAGASKEPDEPLHAGQAGGHSIWFRWEAPQSGLMIFDTFGSTFNKPFGATGNTLDTLLAVYTGDLGSLTRVAANDDATPGLVSRVTFNAVGGATYHVAVDGKDNATGWCQLNWEPVFSIVPSAWHGHRFLAGGRFVFTVRHRSDVPRVIETSSDLVHWTPWDVPGEKWNEDALGSTAKFYRARAR